MNNYKFILGLSLLLFFSELSQSDAQRKEIFIPVDSLLEYFNKYEPLKVLTIVHDHNINFENQKYYFSDSLKKNLLKWLDRDIYLKERVDFQLKDLASDTLAMLNDLKRIYGKGKLDSIRVKPDRFRFVYDSLLMQKRESILAQYSVKGAPFPPYLAIKYHTQLAYPESYSMIKEMWVERGKEMNDIFFYTLLKFGDLEARSMFDNFVEKQILSNGNELSMSILRNLRLYSYGVKKLIELSNIERKFTYLSDGTMKSFSCKILEFLYFDALNYGIKMNYYTADFKSCEDLESIKNDILKTAEELELKLKNAEKYWFKNMPFND